MVDVVLDSNILLRYLTDEPPELAERAARLLEVAEGRRLRVIVAPLTLAEVVFVLESVYAWKRREIADRMLALVSASVLEFLERDVISQTLVWYRNVGTVHFADAYVAALAANRSGMLASFDRAVKRLPGVRVADTAENLPS